MKAERERTMRIKSYFAASIQAAIEQARRELGPDALIMNSREAPPEARHVGAFEVVFALPPAPPPVEASAPADTNSPESPDALRRELDDLRKMIGDLSTSIRGMAPPSAEPDATEEIRQVLIGRGIPANLAESIVKSLAARCAAEVQEIRQSRAALTPITKKALPRNLEELWESLPAELESRLSMDSGLSPGTSGARALALIGPPGAGKTTTLVKLALTAGLRSSRSVQFLSIDTVRIAAVEQLRAYASILGVGFEALETTHAVNQALQDHHHKGLILIDTPGYSRATLAEAAELADYLAGNPAIDTHLVLPASMNYPDLERVVESFSIFQPSRLIFTRLDETGSFGSLYAIAAETGLPISFLATGQSVPEDIEPGSKSKIVDLILPDRVRRAESVA